MDSAERQVMNAEDIERYQTVQYEQHQAQTLPTTSDLYQLQFCQQMTELEGENISTYMETAQSQPDTGEPDLEHQHHKSKKTGKTESPRKRQRSKHSQDGSQSESPRGKADSPGRSGKQSSKKSSQDGRGSGRPGEVPRSESTAMGLLSSPTPSHGSHEGSDVGFKSSLLDEVLTEKKLALLKSPGVKAFLQQQQAQTSASKMSSSKMF